MAEIIPVAFYPNKPTGTLLEATKTAKAQIDTDKLIKPVRAVPGSPGRIIAIGETPPFICEHMVVPAGDTNKLREALEWALFLRDADTGDHAITILREVFGEKVKEI